MSYLVGALAGNKCNHTMAAQTAAPDVPVQCRARETGFWRPRSALVLVLLPKVIGIYIPLIDFLNRSTAVLPK